MCIVKMAIALDISYVPWRLIISSLSSPENSCIGLTTSHIYVNIYDYIPNPGDAVNVWGSIALFSTRGRV